MSVTRALEVLAHQPVSSNAAVESAMRRAVEAFAAHRTESIDAIRHIQAQDPSGFVMVAARLLAATELTKSPGAEYIVGFINNSNLIVDPLLDERIPDELALTVTRGMAEAEPLWDARLMRKVLENAQGTVTAIPREVALRVLWLLDRVSDCSRVSLYLMQLARHPSSEVRSKSALLLGRGNLNMGRVKQFLGSEDGRMRANAVESLWGQNSPQVRDLFRESVTDPNRRVAVNALVGLCKAGDRSAQSKLVELAGSKDPLARRAASWAMGQVGDPEFTATLEVLAHDDDKVVCSMATRSLGLVQVPDASRRWAAREVERPKPAPAPPLIPGQFPRIVPDLQSLQLRTMATTETRRDEKFSPSAPDEGGTTPDLQSYPLASSSRPAR